MIQKKGVGCPHIQKAKEEARTIDEIEDWDFISVMQPEAVTNSATNKARRFDPVGFYKRSYKHMTSVEGGFSFEGIESETLFSLGKAKGYSKPLPD